MTQNNSLPPFSYDPKKLQRELLPYYIGLSDKDITQMLEKLEINTLDDLFSHIQDDAKFKKFESLGPGLGYQELAKFMFDISLMNKPKISFLGDGLQDYKPTDIVDEICGIRGLTTAYTPYQPERSQGTLQSLWIYQCIMSELTGFEAINASLYERSTCLYEAIQTAIRLKRKSETVFVSEATYPQDLEVLRTLAKETKTNIKTYPLNENGQTDLAKLKELITGDEKTAAVVFSQTNTFGVLEDVDAIVDLCQEHKIATIAMFDPILLAEGGLKKPSEYGSDKIGATMIVGEGQHLSLAANFGGPGIGIFGIRYNDKDKRSIRSTAGRYVGKSVDLFGKECKALILSTREQHIRREKATSNICSNQSFIASLTGATVLRRGSEGLKQSIETAFNHAKHTAQNLLSLEGVELLYNSAFFNEFTLKLNKDVCELIKSASEQGLWIGVDVSQRHSQSNLLKLSFSDLQTDGDVEKLISFFKTHFQATTNAIELPEIPSNFRAQHSISLPKLSREEILDYYNKLGQQNLSPDDGIYPLGSCTMKYNPYINDWAAGLDGFTKIHPQAPIQDVQGCLKILFDTQEMFKAITGLKAVTTQPVAGAQGELVGIKMFQAYHRNNGQADSRNIILIPTSAHGTNPATATYAGFETKKVDGVDYGIVLIDANEDGEMDFEQLKSHIEKYSTSIAGIMVTNPNTAGIFESKFKEMSDLIHEVGGLVYMDGANMNAIAGIVDLDAIGVDAVHNNLHKTWTIPHGGGGPGDAIVAVSHRLVDFMPGHQVTKDENGFYDLQKPQHSIGEFHRHFGNFAHKVRAYTYIKALGDEGVRKMSQTAVLSARYLYEVLKDVCPTLPAKGVETPRMHEFIITLSQEFFEKIQNAGTPKANAITRIGKLFLDFGFHAPTVAFPEQYGLMVEPTESFSKAELDEFAHTIKEIYKLIWETPQVLQSVPHFTPIDRVDEKSANMKPQLSESFDNKLSDILDDKLNSKKLRALDKQELFGHILEAHKKFVAQSSQA